MTQDPLFDEPLRQPEPERLRDEGIERARIHADDDWKRYAEICLRRLIMERREVTSYDLTVRLRNDYPFVTTHEPRAIGYLFTKYRRAGWIKAKGVIRHPSPSRHAGTMTVWEVTR